MNYIILISTVHNEIGLCNSNELCKILESINPDVIFLEAFEVNYSQYKQKLFSQFGIFEKRLELKALQKYSLKNNSFEYVPVLDIELSEDFQTKIEIVTKNKEFQRLLDNYDELKAQGGFQFLNSERSILLQNEMRESEDRIVDNEILRQKVIASIEAYEDSMLRNIYSFCTNKRFNTAIFMCGVAHRTTISKKIEKYKTNESLKLNWGFYENSN